MAEAKTGAQKRATWWVWLSLVGSAFGLMSVFNDLIPNLVRLSLLFRAAVSLYRQAREWAFDGLHWLFALVNLHIPEIPQLVQDGVIVAGLMFAALNWESVRRFRQSLLWAICLRFIQQWRAAVSGYGAGREPSSIVFDSTPNRAFDVISEAAAALLLSGLLHLIVRPPIGSIWLLASVPALAVVVYALSTFLERQTGDWTPPPRTLGSLLFRLTRVAISFPAHLIYLLLKGMARGRAAIAAAVAVVVALVATNFLFVRVVDPLLVGSPPVWLVQLIEADPQSLRNAN